MKGGIPEGFKGTVQAKTVPKRFKICGGVQLGIGAGKRRVGMARKGKVRSTADLKIRHQSVQSKRIQPENAERGVKGSSGQR